MENSMIGVREEDMFKLESQFKIWREIQHGLDSELNGENYLNTWMCEKSQKYINPADCIMSELDELRNCLPWKHWKGSIGEVSIDYNNLKLELADLMHFIPLAWNLLSNGPTFKFESDSLHDHSILDSTINTNELLQNKFNHKNTEMHYYLVKHFITSSTEIMLRLEECVNLIQYGDPEDVDASIELFLRLLRCDLTIMYINIIIVYANVFELSISDAVDSLFNIYIVKNALNKIRANNGYKEGTYIKEWRPGVEDNVVAMEIAEECRGKGLDVLFTKLQNYYDLNVNHTVLTTGEPVIIELDGLSPFELLPLEMSNTQMTIRIANVLSRMYKDIVIPRNIHDEQISTIRNAIYSLIHHEVCNNLPMIDEYQAFNSSTTYRNELIEINRLKINQTFGSGYIFDIYFIYKNMREKIDDKCNSSILESIDSIYLETDSRTIKEAMEGFLDYYDSIIGKKISLEKDKSSKFTIFDDNSCCEVYYNKDCGEDKLTLSIENVESGVSSEVIQLDINNTALPDDILRLTLDLNHQVIYNQLIRFLESDDETISIDYRDTKVNIARDPSNSVGNINIMINRGNELVSDGVARSQKNLEGLIHILLSPVDSNYYKDDLELVKNKLKNIGVCRNDR